MSRRRLAKAKALKARIQHTDPSQLTARERYQHMTQCSQCGSFIGWEHGNPTDNRICDKCRE